MLDLAITTEWPAWFKFMSARLRSRNPMLSLMNRFHEGLPSTFLGLEVALFVAEELLKLLSNFDYDSSKHPTYQKTWTFNILRLIQPNLQNELAS